MSADRQPRDRFTGALLALACGDALGAPAEFTTRAQLRARFGSLRDMVGGGRFGWAPGEWTDDTAMTLCVAEGILEAPDDPVEAIGRRFLSWKETAKDVGGTISSALHRYRGSWPDASRSTPAAGAGMAAGNGSLMRTLPLALAYPDRPRMLRQAARVSAMTHWDAQAEVCCGIYCLWIAELLDGASLRDGWAKALALGREWAEEAGATAETPGPSGLPAGFWERLGAFPTIPIERLQPSGYAGYVVDCLEAVVRMVWESEEPESATVAIVNLAGETDTMAAIAGGVLGALSGPQPLPARWLDLLHQRERLEAVARDLSLLRHRLVYATPGLPPFSYQSVADGLIAGRNPLTTEDIAALGAAGVDTILDLREQQEWTAEGRFGREAVAAAEWCGIRRVHVPVQDLRPPSAASLDRACAVLDQRRPDQRIYVHCRAGRERTGAILAAWLARRDRIRPVDAVLRLRADGAQLQPLPDQMRAVAAWLGEP